MKFKELMDLFDNWNGITKVNDNNLNTIIRHKTSTIMEECTDLFDMEVVSFGHYDGELTIRLNIEGYDEHPVHYKSIDEDIPKIDLELDYLEMISIIHGCKSSIVHDKLSLERYNLSPETRTAIENTIKTNEQIIDKLCNCTVSKFK